MPLDRAVETHMIENKDASNRGVRMRGL